MRRSFKWRGVLGVLTAGLWLVAVPAWSAAPVVPERVKSVVRQRVDYGYNVGVVVGLINADGRVFFGYGSLAIGSTQAVDEHTLFEIGSITKVFTTSLLAEAVQRGELAIEAPVQSLLGDSMTVPRQNGEITLQHLATQTSGLPNNPDNLCTDVVRPFECYSTEKLREFLNSHVLAREPGTAWEYSNLGMGLLGHALAWHAGVAYETLLGQRILTPLGLHDTGIEFPAAERVRIAQGHSGVLSRPAFHIPGLEGAGALLSSADDLLTFLAFNLGLRDTPLAPALRDARMRRAATVYEGVDIGLGWWLWALPGGEVVQHSGDTPGQTAFVAFHPARRLGAVVLSNSRANAYSAITDVGLNLLDANYPLTAIRRPAVVPEPTLAEYRGNYQSPDGDRFDVSLVHGRLTFWHVRSAFGFTMYPESSRRFVGHDLELGPGAAGVFTRAVDDRVTRMDWTQHGTTTHYDRLPDPASLGLKVVNGEARIVLTGDPGAVYEIEASEDLKSWRQVATATAGAEPFRQPGALEVTRAFFRAMRK